MKEFFKLTKLKIGLTGLIFILGIFLANIFPIFNCFFIPDIYLLETIVYPTLEEKLNPLQDAFDIWFPFWLFLFLPMRIIYYYFLSCLFVFTANKILPKKKGSN